MKRFRELVDYSGNSNLPWVLAQKEAERNMDNRKNERVAFKMIMATIAVLTTLAICFAALPGCSSRSVATTSAETISFLPACGDDYQTALAAVHEKADDAKLLAIRTSTYCDSDAASNWMYLFYSWKRASAYTVFMINGEANVADMGGMAYNQTDFDAVPDLEGITYDADAAYEELLKNLEGDERLVTCRSYLMTYIAEDDDPTADSFKWFFSFNEEDVNDRGSAVTSDNDAPISSPRAFCVDVRTGEVTELQLAADE